MNLRKAAYFALLGLRGQALGSHYERILREERAGIPPDTRKKLLIQLLAHCQQSVPYYAEVMRDLGDSFYEEPEEYLGRFPILTKDIIRSRFDELKSSDLPRRRWYYNTSGGSTGEPVRFIQDYEYDAQAMAIKLLFSKLVGKEIGECEVMLWGSERDILDLSEEWRTRFANQLTNTTCLNAYRMTPERMREYIAILNAKRPKLLVVYVEAFYEIARFAEREGLGVVPQVAVMTTSGTLYPFMREKLEQVFHCKVFDRYGSREVGDVACERPGYEGLWVAPWGNYVEIVDSEGHRVPDGADGEILVTSLTNFAMPLVRYKIGDRGVLAPVKDRDRNSCGQVLKTVLGRTLDIFKAKGGVLFDPGYLMELLYFREWVRKYQIVQKSLSNIVFRIVRSDSECPQAELDEISAKTKLIMGDDCQVTFEFVDEIAASGSGKYRYTISEVQV